MNTAEKEFEKADIANAGKRAEELQMWVDSYKCAIRDLEISKAHLKSIVDQAKDKGFSKGMLDAVLVSKRLLGVEKIAFLDVVRSKTPETDNKCEDVGVCTCEK